MLTSVHSRKRGLLYERVSLATSIVKKRIHKEQIHVDGKVERQKSAPGRVFRCWRWREKLAKLQELLCNNQIILFSAVSEALPKHLLLEFFEKMRVDHFVAFLMQGCGLF
jgi:hypothetical protein